MQRILLATSFASTFVGFTLGQTELTGISWKDLGQLAAFVVTVLLFLKYLTTRDQKIENMFDQVMTRVENNQKASEQHLTSIQAEFLRVSQIQQSQMQKVFDDHMVLTRQAITAISAMQAAFGEILDPKSGNRPQLPTSSTT